MAIAHLKEKRYELLHEEILDLSKHLQEILWARQEERGDWHFALDDNITMNAEFILFHRWLALSDEPLVQRLAQHIFNTQREDGSWSIYYAGPGNLSASVEAYFALRAAGFSPDLPALRKAREFILSEGGIPSSRVFTKIWLALFGLYPWKGVPIIPPEILFAPRGLPFHLLEFSYWSRTTIVPLTILFHLQKMRKVDFNLDELYLTPADKNKTDFLTPPPVDDSWILRNKRWDFPWINWEQVFIAMNKGVMFYESAFPIKPLRALAVAKAKKWILDHQEESGDWGGIQPPMINSIMALHALGMELSEEPIQKGLAALHRFTRGQSKVIRPHQNETENVAVLQSCVSPIWDTALSALSLLESGARPEDPRLQKAKDFLWANRITTRGDWAEKAKLKRKHPFAAWCFQYHNSEFPDVDDSCVVTLVLHKLGMSSKELIPALHWIRAMQNSDGGWGTFDRDNNQTILNRIPFADLKSLIDPSNPDITGHVLETLGELGLSHSHEVRQAIRYLKTTQKTDGSWFGRWGVNYLYGTSAAIIGLRKVGEPVQAPYLQRAVKFILSHQNDDGGWGESCGSYALHAPHATGASTPSQTGWALMALASCRNSPSSFEDAIRRGVHFLNSRRAEDGLEEVEFTGTGFPQHFYLRYDGYRTYFPLIALGRLSQPISNFEKS